ncbi:low affinity immunoglobulin epsilon Fc receptor-like [Physella acuta]|uniref:low affinity immunoglobulin epsilon Fc receptor-like n=1 Tax=Physella acuta TaxID=109671 RepID=UPI0027DBF878|nr:low affinity immunoglobulin epsilon Fc receptor-like [Physella acuta]
MYMTGTTQWDGAKVVDGKCFLLVQTVVKWDQAKQACEDMGGTLATVSSATLMSDIRSAFNYYVKSYWIGLNDIANEGTYVWIEDGSTASGISSLWGEDRPVTDPDNGFDCIYVDGSNTFLDVQCAIVATNYLCMEPNSATTKCPDLTITTEAATTTKAVTTESSETTPPVATTLTSATTSTTKKHCKKG